MGAVIALRSTENQWQALWQSISDHAKKTTENWGQRDGQEAFEDHGVGLSDRPQDWRSKIVIQSSLLTGPAYGDEAL
jgi:hypothetical protein